MIPELDESRAQFQKELCELCRNHNVDVIRDPDWGCYEEAYIFHGVTNPSGFAWTIDLDDTLLDESE